MPITMAQLEAILTPIITKLNDLENRLETEIQTNGDKNPALSVDSLADIESPIQGQLAYSSDTNQISVFLNGEWITTN